MFDLYYRFHWCCADKRINGRESKINEGLVFERGKALEWLMNKDYEWDDVAMDT